MDVSVISAHDLDADLIHAWKHLQSSNPELASPYFAPEFTQAVAAVPNEVEIAVMGEDGRPIGFFPYQRGARDVAEPVGGILSDYQGIICAPGFDCDPLQLLKSCRLKAWDFDHLLASQSCFLPF